MTDREAFEAWRKSECHPGTTWVALAEWNAWQASRKQMAEEAERAHAAERLELHNLRQRWDSQSRMVNDLLAKKELMAEMDAKTACLATFAHEVLMGAYAPAVCMWKARAALERAGLGRLEDVVALTQPRSLATPTEGKPE